MGMKMSSNIFKMVILIILYFFLLGLFFSLFIMSLSIPGSLIDALRISNIEPMSVLNVGAQLVYLVNYLLVVKMLIGIIKSTWETPFIVKNVKRFKVMAWCLTINVAFECFMGYGASKYASIQIFSNGKGALSPIMIIGIIAALMCFVMAEVFDKAIKIKEDNDLTI